MQAFIKFVCRDFVGGFDSGTFDVVPGDTVATFMRRVIEENGIKPIENLEDYIIVIKNASSAELSDPVEDDDKVYILRRILGG